MIFCTNKQKMCQICLAQHKNKLINPDFYIVTTFVNPWSDKNMRHRYTYTSN